MTSAVTVTKTPTKVKNMYVPSVRVFYENCFVIDAFVESHVKT